MISKNDLIYISGHKGLVGSAILRKLKKKGYINLIYRTRKQLNLLDTQKVYNFLRSHKPKFVFIAAAKVGGILCNNNYPADFIYENLKIQNNLICGSWKAGIKNLIFLGSSCIYPRNCKQPMKEEYILSGPLEPTNEAYAIAKIAGIKMCQSFNKQYKTNYKCLMPTNAFGPNDNYDTLNSHFVPALIKKIDLIKNKKIKKLVLWGNGNEKREIIHSDEIADACIYFMNKKKIPDIINIGSGKEYKIKEYAEMFLKYLNVKAKIILDKSKPSGMPRKVMNVSLAKKYGWSAKNNLKDSIVSTYMNYLNEK
jgi:GDP-L-fucose synthase